MRGRTIGSSMNPPTGPLSAGRPHGPPARLPARTRRQVAQPERRELRNFAGGDSGSPATTPPSLAARAGRPLAHQGAMRFRTARALVGLALASGLTGGCKSAGDDTSGSNNSIVPQDVQAIIFIQRTARNDGMGNVFDYTSYEPGGRLVKLEPPSANGKLTVLT